MMMNYDYNIEWNKLNLEVIQRMMFNGKPSQTEEKTTTSIVCHEQSQNSTNR